MALTQEFMDAVNNGNKLRVRIMIKDGIVADPTLYQIDEMLRYASSHMPNLFDSHNGEKLNYDIAAWSTDYLNQEMVTLISNFSQERLDLLKNMVRHIYKDDVVRIQQKRNSQRAASHSSGPARKQVGAGAVAVGAALAIAGVCTSHTALIVGGVVVAAAGAAVILTDKR